MRRSSSGFRPTQSASEFQPCSETTVSCWIYGPHIMRRLLYQGGCQMSFTIPWDIWQPQFSIPLAHLIPGSLFTVVTLSMRSHKLIPTRKIKIQFDLFNKTRRFCHNLHRSNLSLSKQTDSSHLDGGWWDNKPIWVRRPKSASEMIWSELWLSQRPWQVVLDYIINIAHKSPCCWLLWIGDQIRMIKFMSIQPCDVWKW